MNEYNIINRCLNMLRSSKVDVMTKLRMESLLIGMKMLLLTDIYDEQSIPDLEDLFTHIKAVCTPGVSADGVNGLVDHVRKMQSEMVECLNLG